MKTDVSRRPARDARAVPPALRMALAALLWFVAVAGVGSSGLLYYYEQQTVRYETGVSERAELMLDALESVVGAHLRRGMYHPEELNAIFSRMQLTPMMMLTQLEDGAGEAIVVAAAPTEDGEPPAADGAFMRTRIIEGFGEGPRGPRPEGGMGRGPEGGMGRGPEGGMGRGPGRGRGRGMGYVRAAADPGSGWRPMPAGPYRMTVWVDTARWRGQVRALRWQVGSAAGVLLLVALLGILVIVAGHRQRRLHTQLLLAEESAAHHEKLARLGAGLAHETKNPLGLVRGLAQLISEAEGTDERLRGQARQIIDETDRIVGQINGFLGFAKPKEPMQRRVDLDRCIAGLLPLLEQEAAERGVQLVCPSTALAIEADEDLFRRALLNILINALHACEAGDTVRVAAQETGRHVVLEVSDTGCGIAASDLKRITEPYFARFTEGTGLGLAVVSEIVRSHGWQLSFASVPGQGTTVRIAGMDTVRSD